MRRIKPYLLFAFCLITGMTATTQPHLLTPIQKSQGPFSDSCYKSFFKTYGMPGGMIEIKDACRTSDGGYVIVGFKGPEFYPCVIKLNRTGAVEWSKSFENLWWAKKVFPAADGNFLVVTISYKTQITKLSNTGAILWSKEYSNLSGYDLTLYDMQPAGDGGFVAIFNAAYGSGPTFNYMIRIGADGNIIWKKEIVHGFIEPLLKSVLVDSNAIFIAADFYTSGIADQQMEIIRLDLGTGSMTWKKKLQATGTQVFDPHLTKINDTLIISAIRIDPSTPFNFTTKLFIVALNENTGALLNAYKFNKPELCFAATYYAINDMGPFHLNKTTDNQLFFAQQVYLNNDTSLNITKFSSSGNITWSKTYKNLKTHDIWSVKSDNDKLLICGRRWVSYPNMTDISFLLQADQNGNITPETLPSNEDCYNESVTPETEAMTLAELPSDFVSSNDYGMITSNPYLPLINTFSVTVNESCFVMDSTCNVLSVTGPDSVCAAGGVYTYVALRAEGCDSRVEWTYDPLYVSQTSVTDTSITVQFLTPGDAIVSGHLFSTCYQVVSEKTIHITRNAASLNLGPDRQICFPGEVSLNAGKGFAGYSWSDGSTDSVYTVTIPGNYYVIVIDSCGNFFSDTIVISPAAPIPFDIGPDRTKCNNDTLHLNAPVGFLNYLWGPSYNISSLSAQQVIVQPAVDTFYFVKGEITPGCFVYDTVKIKVSTSPSVLLGPDKSFCQGDSAILNAGTGFNQYQWSNGNASQQITVHSTGNYSVIGTTSAGCKSYDTLRIVNVWPTPVVTLDDNPGLCTGDTRVLNAGNFNSYRWQNGSTASSFVVAGTGTYYVTVWDNNQCKGSDTVRVTRMLPLPANFLPVDTAICIYGNLLIKPSGSFTTYSWSNNAVSSSISVTVPGIYWLQVKDASNCTGRDSILVNPKECLKGFYIPNAFSPDHNGRNDDFKPFIGGIVKQYQFTIYNRWGQVIFTTKDLYRGWDGNFGGTKQDTNVFAWMCTYQLEGEIVKQERGTVVLIR